MTPARDPRVEPRRWLSIDDDSTTWLFDIAFLLSSYHCIYGQGCRSIEVEPGTSGSTGCCTHGAHFIDSKDRRRVAELATQLDDDEWQHREQAEQRRGPIKKKKDGEWVTRKVDGACIFLNRDDFAGGPGCALHVAALNRGERPLDWKPTVCWQVPIRLDVHTDDYGYETVMVRAWERRDWGPGGRDFHWWCTEAAEAYTAPAPVYETSRDELVELVGTEIYDRLVLELGGLRAETPVTIGARNGVFS
ncbi:MAG: hypothetical protein OEV40_05260 [Acidimicrobiia bacterium]|nr:hypothetical protein [Acidimicrobiia bacterium]